MYDRRRDRRREYRTTRTKVGVITDPSDRVAWSTEIGSKGRLSRDNLASRDRETSRIEREVAEN